MSLFGCLLVFFNPNVGKLRGKWGDFTCDADWAAVITTESQNRCHCNVPAVAHWEHWVALDWKISSWENE